MKELNYNEKTTNIPIYKKGCLELRTIGARYYRVYWFNLFNSIVNKQNCLTVSYRCLNKLKIVKVVKAQKDKNQFTYIHNNNAIYR